MDTSFSLPLEQKKEICFTFCIFSNEIKRAGIKARVD